MGTLTLPSVCMGTIKGKIKLGKAKIILPHGLGCDPSKTPMKRVLDLPCSYQVRVHRSCVCNEYAALATRHLIDRRTKTYSPKWFQPEFDKTADYLFDQMLVEPMRIWDVVKSYKGAKRRMYAKAYAELLTTGYREEYSRVKMFVKPDKYAAAEIESKAPRAIQYRHPIFNLLLAKFLKPVEEMLYQTVDQFDMRWCAKGLNNRQRARLIVAAADCFIDPVFLLIDHSKFDSTVTVEHLKTMHRFYQRLIPDRTLSWLLRSQLHNRGLSSHGIRYRVAGTKMSGDYNTALDNSLLNFMCLRLFSPNGKIVVDGDDSVLIIERAWLSEHQANFYKFAKMGFTTEMQVVHTLQEVEFCRSKIIDIDDPVMAREPRRAISGLTVTLKGYQGKGLEKYIAGNALCEMHRSSGVPITLALGKALYERYGRKGVILDTDAQYKLDMYKDEIREPTAQARMDYYMAYGITPAQQLSIEDELRQLKCPGGLLFDAAFEAPNDVVF